MNPTRLFRSMIVGFVVLGLLITALQPQQSAHAAGVVGTGTPVSCTEAAFEAALTGGGLVTFNCGGSAHTIILTSYKAITDDTEIQGDDLITLSGGNATSIFMVNETLTLRNITLTHGFGDFGTIRNYGTLHLIGSQITYGHSNFEGGAIQNYGTVTIDDSTLAHNSTDIAAGAIMNFGEVTIQNSQVYSNTAQENGGAIKNNNGTMEIHNSQIYDNQSLDCAAGSVGGGILSSGTLTVTQSTISNNIATYGGGIFNAGTVFLENVTIEGNRTYGACYGSGGGMVNAGQATVVSSEFRDNIAAASYGGGLSNRSNSQMTITDSTFTQNQSQGGGAISNSGSLTLTNSTVFTNTSGYGGGIANGVAGGTPNILILTNVTVSDNSSAGSGGGLQTDNGVATVTFATFMNNRGDSGVEQNGGVLNFKNSIIANSSPKNCEGTITSQGFNISSDYSCAFSQGGDKNNTDPLLGPLTNNGGSTLTHLPQTDSPAVDGGQCVAGITTDQRGVLRPQAAACDIGSVERREVMFIFLPMLSR